jgi:hypothetical protein
MASAVAAIASVVVAVVLGRRAEAISVAQRRHSAFSTAAEWRRDLTAWAAEVVDVLSEAAYSFGDDSRATKAEQLFACSFRLSALIDRGRFFLPNIRQDEHGADKPPAYRGYRHSALDPLVAAEGVLSTGKTGSFTDERDALVEMKREFVSALQQILDPQHHNREIAKVLFEGHKDQRSDPTLGGLLPDNRNIPRGADALLTAPRSRRSDIPGSDSVSPTTSA